MLLIKNILTDPFFNIAAEEYLLKESRDDIFMLYVNEPSIIVGKHQNALAEVNIRLATENNIPVIRRISGGGTVYHDGGNLNFSFITNGREGQLIDFRKYTKPIIEILQNSGIGARFEGKSDIKLNGLKISGNAEHVYKDRVLHHGTLLISSDLKRLAIALEVSPDKYKDQAIKSIRSKTTNIGDLLVPSNNKIDDIQNQIISYLNKDQNYGTFEFSNKDIEAIKNLIYQKYDTWDWNFGYSPPYEFRNRISIDGKKTKIQLKVEKGIIKEVNIKGEHKFQEYLRGIRHYYPEIHKILNAMPHLNSQDVQELTWSFF